VAHEVKNLELLKLRFGESAFRECEIMLRDVEESQYLDATSGECAHLRVLVISQVFWPSLPDDSLEFHPSCPAPCY